MNRWPWLTIIFAAITFLNPIGREFFRAAFFSNEQLSRNIAQPFVLTAILILVALGLFEWWFKRWLRQRREKPAP